MEFQATEPPSEVAEAAAPLVNAFGPFRAPTRAILNHQDFEKFLKSSAHTEILDFIKQCAEAVVGIPCSYEGESCPIVNRFILLMNRLHEMIGEVPPIKQPMRFGNKAFRDWHARLTPEVEAFLADVLPAHLASAAVEFVPYFLDMFGNPTRIDYGTGHELNFAIVFLLLHKLSLLPSLRGVVVHAFKAYIRTMRRLQTEYLLEPAGSHGVWGLDDYHCLLFVWGAAQLSTTEIKPSDVHDAATLSEYASEYLYLEGIQFIRSLKTGAAFSETSPMLNDISHLADWARICSGLLRLFQAEVLNKFPVIQHLVFGSLLKAAWVA